ncbi:unnamed protein product [Lactuca virosa]|uniref:Uncharacterized protein n=1 Tax=Lactuca virosa TaxID=75947 RepID=A0AAU9PX29_9ASTR|nr:unnamed protein product [Lactuca virosa]
MSMGRGFEVDVALEVVHLTDEYWDKVVSYIIDEYKCGRTPNPDLLCNTRIKFGAFMDALSNMDFEFVASGHYAKVIHPLTDETNELSFLQLSKDMIKICSTYFHYQLPDTYYQDEVQRFARKVDFPNQERRDSQGICFLGKVRHGLVFYDCSLHIEEKDGIGTVQLKVGKEEKLDKFELPANIKFLPDPWKPKSGLVTAALKLKREQLKAKFKDDSQKLYE